MKFTNFLKDKLRTAILIIFAIITIEIFLALYPIGLFIKIYIPVIIFIMLAIGMLFEYFKKRSYYNEIKDILDKLDEKYLISEMIRNPSFEEGKILKELLEEVNKSMVENVNKYKYLQEDYKEYIELWIHEVKTPIAASRMIIENNKNDITKSISEEIKKIENYVEQALFYARSNTAEKDYFIKKTNLKDIVNESIRKNKNILIQEKATLDIHDVDVDIYTDVKWIEFIIDQIIQNSVKYKRQNISMTVEFFANTNKENVVLCIKDNGIGIKEGEIARVFEKGFTGTNGRLSNKKSTGIGLYLCKKLCDKLGVRN